MAKHGNKPHTVFCTTADQARERAAADRDSKALVTAPGTMGFHLTIAQHGAGEFRTMYVAPELRGRFVTPVGGTVEEAN